MDLSFHHSTDDANASLSILSIYYLTLTDYFSFYAALQPQFYDLKENEFVTIQSFMHFIKTFKLARSRKDTYDLLIQMEGIITYPIDDTLNIKNGLNFAKFLEAILRIAYMLSSS